MHFSFSIVWVPREIERGTLLPSPFHGLGLLPHPSVIFIPLGQFMTTAAISLIPGQAEASLSLTLSL